MRLVNFIASMMSSTTFSSCFSSVVAAADADATEDTLGGGMMYTTLALCGCRHLFNFNSFPSQPSPAHVRLIRDGCSIAIGFSSYLSSFICSCSPIALILFASSACSACPSQLFSDPAIVRYSVEFSSAATNVSRHTSALIAT